MKSGDEHIPSKQLAREAQIFRGYRMLPEANATIPKGKGNPEPSG